MTHPPAYAQALVEMLAPGASRESIVGDLLEEYRETQVPERGTSAADRWFVRQALGFLWRASSLPGAGIAAILTVRMLLDVGVPSYDLAQRAAVTTYATMALFVLFGFRLGRTTGRAGGAAPMALGATFIGTLYAWAMVFLCMGVASTLVDLNARAWMGLREGLDVPAPVIAVIGVVLATAGAAAGRAFPRKPLSVRS